MKRGVSGLILVLLLVNMLTLAFDIRPISAATRIVPDDYPTIQAAINTANSGDTIFVRNGTYYENLVANKSISIIGENKDTTIIDGSRSGGIRVIGVTANGVLVSGFTIQNGWHSNIMIVSNNSKIIGNRILNSGWMGGIYVQYGANNIIQNNIFSNNSQAIYLYWGTSVNNTVSNNLIINNSLGMFVTYSKNNIIMENTLSNNHEGMLFSWDSGNNNISSNLITDNEYGIHFSACSGKNIMRENIMTDNKYSLVVDGWDLSDYDQDIDASNTVNEKPIYYLVGQTNVEIPAGAGYIGAVNCEGITVKGQELSHSGQGVMFAYTTGSVIEDTNMSGNYQGVYLLYSSNNEIAHNNFINNEYQVWSYYSTNTWDYGYPYGNYWSDYAGADMNNDGIGDVPYVIDMNNRDRYPLMNPWKPTPTIEHDITTSIVAPTFQRLGTLSVLEAIVMNRGLNDEFGVQLFLKINGSTLESATLPPLESGSSQSFSYSWTPTTEGTYNLTVYSPSVHGETSTDNNVVTFLVFVAAFIRVPEYVPTIQLAIDIANTGDTILVGPGTYYENVMVTKDGLSLIGSGADVTIIDGQGKYNVVYKPYSYSISTFTIEGFTIRNSNSSGSLPGGAGIHLDGDGTYIIRRNKIQDNYVGIAVWNHWGPVVIIEDSVISNNIWDGIEGYCGDMIMSGNTIAFNGASGYSDDAGAGAKYFVNNVIVSNGAYGINPYATTPRYIAYNDVWNNSEGDFYETGYFFPPTPFTPSPGTGEISADPLFVDAAGRDYHLSEGSPCIDAGTNENASNIDLDGKPRPIDGNGDGTAIVDMGACEFGLPTYALTITMTVGGTTNPTFGTYAYAVDSSIDVTAIPNLNCSFDHWELDSTNVGSTNPYTIQISNNHTLKAIFTLLATTNIEPDTLNLKGKEQWITSYVEFPEGYDVNNINVSTIMLNNTISAELGPTAIGDYDNDAIPDLMVEFNRTAVAALILSKGIFFGNVTITITGQLSDGTMLEGNDIIRVRMPGDVNIDGKADTKDLLLVAKAFGESSGGSRWNPTADENEDGKITIIDVFIVARNFGRTYT
jgi:parallel beta-helix repeat protein